MAHYLRLLARPGGGGAGGGEGERNVSSEAGPAYYEVVAAKTSFTSQTILLMRLSGYVFPCTQQNPLDPK